MRRRRFQHHVSVNKLSVDVKADIQHIITYRKVDGKHLNDEEIRSYQSVLDDSDFWRQADIEPQPLTGPLGFRVNTQYIFQNCAYEVTGKFITPEQAKLLIQDKVDSERRKFERLHHKFNLAQNTEPRTNRTGIPEEVRIAVWRRDGGRCVRCSSRERLEYDHIVPVTRGGSNTVRNIELLCETCNRNKGANMTGVNLFFALKMTFCLTWRSRPIARAPAELCVRRPWRFIPAPHHAF